MDGGNGQPQHGQQTGCAVYMRVCVRACVLHINPKWTMNVKRNKLEMTINEQVSLALGDSVCVWEGEADFWWAA